MENFALEHLRAHRSGKRESKQQSLRCLQDEDDIQSHGVLHFLLRSHLPRLHAFPTAGAGNREWLASAGGGGPGARAGGGGDEARLGSKRQCRAQPRTQFSSWTCQVRPHVYTGRIYRRLPNQPRPLSAALMCQERKVRNRRREKKMERE
ncbi:uncharacterized protein LOC144615037 isoform X2 [Panthera onca]